MTDGETGFGSLGTETLERPTGPWSDINRQAEDNWYLCWQREAFDCLNGLVSVEARTAGSELVVVPWVLPPAETPAHPKSRAGQVVYNCPVQTLFTAA